MMPKHGYPAPKCRHRHALALRDRDAPLVKCDDPDEDQQYLRVYPTLAGSKLIDDHVEAAKERIRARAR